MSDRTCPRHHLDLVPNVGDGFKCPIPGCSHSIKERHLFDEMHFTEGLGLQGNSTKMIGGQPQHEFAQSSGDGLPSTAINVERLGGGSTVKMSFDSAEPYKPNKKKDEQDAVERFRAQYNENHGTAFSGAEPEEKENHPVDVWLTEQSQPRIGCQVTRSDGRQMIGRALADHGRFSETIAGQEAWKIMAEAIAGKHTKTGGMPGLVLVLDGVIPSVHGLLEEFKAHYAEAIEGSPFSEIWYSGRGVGAVVKRLK